MTEQDQDGFDAIESDAGDESAVPIGGEFAELDRLYREALDAMDAVASDLNSVSSILSSDEDIPEEDADVIPFSAAVTAEASEKASLPEPSPLTVDDEEPEERLDHAQVIESILFVGGAPITTRRLCSVLGDSLTPEMADQRIDRLNAQYARENRPYEITFGEGGYRMALRPEFDRIRSRVFGFGPKEVKLSQEALEVLALVAYKQPITREKVTEIGNDNSGNVLRQLLRRELIALDRSSNEDGETEVSYRTTSRFLHVFGIGDLDELPRSEDVDFK